MPKGVGYPSPEDLAITSGTKKKKKKKVVNSKAKRSSKVKGK